MKYRPTPPLQLLRRFVRSVENYGPREAVVRSSRRLFRSLKSHGLSGTFERAFVKAPEAPNLLGTASTHPFDQLHGTDTGGYFSGADSTATSLSAMYVTAYLGIPPSTLRPALEALPIKYEDFAFVDVGCGKGRALLISAEYPFRRVFGVEIACELCDIARANVALMLAWQHRITVFNQDATNFVFPEGPLIIYFYYPFFKPILRRVLANLERQLRRAPRPVYILYADVYWTELADVKATEPRCRKMMKSFSSICEVSDMAIPIAADETAAEPSGAGVNRFTLFSVDISK